MQQSGVIGERPTRTGATSGRRVPRLSLLAVTLAGAVAAGLTTGCSMADAQCSSGEYPVAAVGAPAGGACVSNDEEPPSGFVRYPKGQVPKHVDDKWDKYWSEHALDADGNVVKN